MVDVVAAGTNLVVSILSSPAFPLIIIMIIFLIFAGYLAVLWLGRAGY